MKTTDETAVALFDALAQDTPGPTAAAPAASVTGALFSMPRTTQWFLEQIQLVNWGGFDGPETVELDRKSTLLSGTSGSGKSTLLDAYTAVMMPSDVSFNGASNEATGRARGFDQRSVVSYIRGQLDVTTDADGNQHAEVLRGSKSAAWGGAAVVFANDNGGRFTAARLWYVPPTARLGSEAQMRMLTLEGPLTLRDAEPLAANAFPPHKLKALFPGLRSHDTYSQFAGRLHSQLGIGANGDGDKALKLLARVQGTIQFRTVDALYKECVLEKPETYEHADRALEHFGHLADTYRKLSDEARKESILRRIPEHWETLTGARETIATLDDLGTGGGGTSPLTIWETNREADLVAAAEVEARQHLSSAKQAEQAAKQALTAAGVRVDEARAEYNERGGGDVSMLNVAISHADLDVATRSGALDNLTQQVGSLVEDGVDLTDRAVFDRLRTQGQQAAADVTAERRRLSTEVTEILVELRTKGADLTSARQNLARLETSGSRIGEHLERLRDAACQRAGIDISEAPFLAELVQPATSEARWTTAIEKVLGPAGSRMLVPDEKLDAFQRAVNDLKVRGELRFDGAASNLPEPPPAAANTTAGKLDFAPGPYRGWVMRKVAEPSNNAICVEDPANLGRGGYRVTLTGQTRYGRSGSLGSRSTARQLGFSNDDLRADAKQQIALLERDIRDLERRKSDLDQQLDTLTERHSAHRVLAAAVFDSIDVREARARLADKQADLQRILDGNNVLKQLEQKVKDLEAARDDAVHIHGRARDKVADLDKQWNAFASRRDTLTDRQDYNERRFPDLLTDTTASYLEDQFEALCAGGDPDDLAAFPGRMSALRRTLEDAKSKAVATETKATTDLEGTFEQFLSLFPSNSLTPKLAAYPDFAQILADINARGLHERRADWRQALMSWSGKHLFQLHQAMDSAVEAIEDRLVPINTILWGLPFGPTDRRLQMRMRKVRRDEVTAFRRKLKELSSTATIELEDHQMEARFKDLENFMAKLRSPKDPEFDPKLARRDDLLDVRRHVEVLAERQALDHTVEATYASIASKSGGETQELIAFIVGSALRFRLGDEEREQPRFAPVILDEAFIKSDAQFASRAVQAWSGLGFQLIIGAPMDKFGALEPHMNRFLLVTKNQTTKHSRVRTISDAERTMVRAGARG
ncbi:hypothetical protein CBR64_17790 [Cellulosimicrobium cellulans]|uniref:ATP-binding protein n=1 Tax=Cellulosimicrobium cellulans TaxID=1710 RepID=A0A1Y0HYA7_CELCE|nr:ATP-binding protein [Cellulosimicrobium cellulans]ARU53009.1 hypothetical protein CBR64_17790 [Cellulosimicrobium cellulans]